MGTSAEVSFGEWLKRRRKGEGWTQEQLAEQLSCSTSTLRKLEAEERRPSAQIVERLAEIFHIPPSEQVSFLRFARGDWQSAPTTRSEDTDWRTPNKAPRSNLPAAVTSLIGRDQEIAHLSEYLSNQNIRLVTLIGPPGIGKTRLSIEAARVKLSDFSDGVFFVALALLEDPGLVAPTIAQTLGFIETKNRSPFERLKDGIGAKQMLIVLDNVEHLLEEIAILASSLLSACSRLKILATSREGLHVLGEWLYHVPTLNIPVTSQLQSLAIEEISQYTALTLFAERARAVRSDFVINVDNIEAVAKICTQLDGLPLAIELIAARIRLMSPQSLLERLTNQFTLYANGMRAVSARQKTLHDAIAWSYDLLSSQEQKLFMHLSVFAGGFTLDVAEALFSQTVSDKLVSDLIASLLDKSLLQSVPNARGDPLYIMLVTIQEFARECLRSAGEETELRNRHLAYFLNLAEKGDHEIRGPGQVEWLDRLNAMKDNLRAALEWAIATQQTELASQLVRKQHWFWFVRGEHSGARHWFRRVLDMPDIPLHPEAYTEALTQLAEHVLYLGDEQEAIEAARPLLEQALSVARLSNDERNIYKALDVLAAVLTLEQNFAAAQSILEESTARCQEIHDEWGYANAMFGLAFNALAQEEWATALTLYQQALARFQKLGDKYKQSLALRFIGRSYVNQGDVTSGTVALRESLILAQQLHSKGQIAMILWRGFAEAALRMQQTARAVSLYSASKSVIQSLGAWMESDELLFENELAPCRAALGEEAFAAAWAEGRAMTMERAIAYALE